MKLFLILLSLSFALGHEPLLVNYHENVGIRKAEEIRQAEHAIDFDGARVIGGEAAALGAYPFMGGLVITLTTGATSVCGSTLVTPSRLLTAAHCWWDGRFLASQFTVVLGSILLFSGGTRITTNNVEMHSLYNTITLTNDIAMIRINAVSTSEYIRPISLPSGNQLTDNFAGTWAQVIGFGRTGDASGITTGQFLSHASLQVITNNECWQTYGNAIIASTLCTSAAYGSATCGGDSGGPLVVDSTLIGVVSFGAARGCEFGFPNGHARVTAFINWISVRL